MRKSFLMVYNAKKMFPISGKGWVVQRVKHPTRNRGSQVLWAKTFKTKKQAQIYANRKEIT